MGVKSMYSRESDPDISFLLHAYLSIPDRKR